MTRVAVFIDYQNAYMRAREVFGDPKVDPFTFGQVYPRRLGLQLKMKGQEVDPTRTLEAVRVYRGEPDDRQSPVAQAACQRQVRYWEAQARVSVVTRPLRYLPIAWNERGHPTEWKAREKGIDVLIVLNMAIGAVNDAYDVAVLVSADTDLVPALEVVIEAGKRVEVASWWPDHGYGSRLTVPGQNVWCHRLRRADFDRVRDDTDYTKPQPSERTPGGS